MNYNEIVNNVYQEETDDETEETDEEMMPETWNEYQSNINIPELNIKLLEREEYIVVDSISRLEYNINTHPCDFYIKFGINDSIGQQNINRYENNREIVSRRTIEHLNNMKFYTKDIVTIIEKVYSSSYSYIENIYKNVVQLELVRITIPILPNKIEYNNINYNIYDKYSNYIFELENFNSNIKTNNTKITNIFSVLTPSRLTTNYENVNLNNGFIDLFPIGNFAKYFRPTPLSKLDRLHLKLNDDNGDLLDKAYNDHLKIDYLDIDIDNMYLIVKMNEYSEKLFNIGDNVILSFKANIDSLTTISEQNEQFSAIVSLLETEERYLLIQFMNIYLNEIHPINKLNILSNATVSNKIYMKLPINEEIFKTNGTIEFDTKYNVINQQVTYNNENYSLLKLFSIFLINYIADIYIINYSKRYTYTFKIKYLIPDSNNLTINKFV